MRSISLFAILVLGSLANACPQAEAQFIAKVKSVSKVEGRCGVELSQVIQWSENQLCPLRLEDAIGKKLIASSIATCQLTEGDTVSGIIVEASDGVLFF